MDIEIILDQHDGFGAREMDLGQILQTCAYSMAVPLFAAQNRLEPFFHQLPAHAVEHGGAGVQGLPDLLSLHPAPATTSAPLFYLRAILAGAMRAAVLLLPTPMQSTSD